MRSGAPDLLRVSASEEEAEHVRRHVEALSADGFPGALVERDGLPPALRRASSTRAAPTTTARLQPARWIRALAGAAERAGARIHERVEVARPVSGLARSRTTAAPSAPGT